VKVRLADDEIRIRLDHGDVERLVESGVVECVVMPGTYSVRLTTSVHERSEVTFGASGIDVTIPPSALPDPSRDFEPHRWGGDAGHPEVIVDLDKQRRPKKRGAR
jgi:hypothetical protein